MFGFCVVLIIVLVVLFKLGFFRRAKKCSCCGKSLKGTEQKIFGIRNKFILCKECADKIHPQIYEFAKNEWSYSDYEAYIAWDESTREERAKFQPDEKYGLLDDICIDTEKRLFCIGSGKKEGLVFRFADLREHEIDFKPQTIKEGLLGDSVRGDEYIIVKLYAPRVRLERIINYSVKLKLKKEGFISPKYLYQFPADFNRIINTFLLCSLMSKYSSAENTQNESINISEIEKALALFMFENVDEVTEETLRKQRNALIKAFHPDTHPDNVEANVAYSQKINAAYEVLSNMLKNKTA